MLLVTVKIGVLYIICFWLQCFCQDCKVSIQGNITQVVSKDNRLFRVGQSALCLQENQRNISQPKPPDKEDIAIKCAFLLPSLLFVAAFVCCFISAIYICKAKQIGDIKKLKARKQLEVIWEAPSQTDAIAEPQKDVDP